MPLDTQLLAYPCCFMVYAYMNRVQLYIMYKFLMSVNFRAKQVRRQKVVLYVSLRLEGRMFKSREKKFIVYLCFVGPRGVFVDRFTFSGKLKALFRWQ